jgi:hypothetical protein
MGVHHEARLAERAAEDQAGGLAADTRQDNTLF